LLFLSHRLKSESKHPQPGINIAQTHNYCPKRGN
jgi:hypothetical protein